MKLFGKGQQKDIQNLIRHGQNYAKILLEIEPTTEREKTIRSREKN